MKKQKWSEFEVKYLKENYQTKDMSEIINDLNRSMSSITNKAYLLDLPNRVNRLCSLKPLLSETNEAYYWLGFLMADGHFTNKGQIQVNLSIKDLEHLKKFSNFVKYENELTKASLYVQDKLIVNEICDRYHLKNNKTYTPPIINNIDGLNNFFSLIIGFIDGDGNIDKNGYLRIKVHKNWSSNIELMMSHLSDNYNINFDSYNLVTGSITRIEIMKEVKQKALKLNLPILKRKWDNVNLDKLSKNERREKLDNICFNLFEKDKKPVEVIKYTDISSTFIYASFKRWNDIKKKDMERDLDRKLK
jgi:hypothetical protein